MIHLEREAKAPVILVVDDDVTLRIIAREHLESAGFIVEEATDGLEAIKQYRSIQPDAILMDVVMPRMDGITACAEIRQDPGAETLPILILTAHDDIGEIERAYTGGATDFTSKPINWTIEVHRLQYMLRAAAVAKELQDKEAQLLQSQKMEAVGRLAGGVAHDFNNLLTVITSFIQFGAERLSFDHESRRDLGKALQAAQQGSALTRQLLSFSRPEVASPEPLRLNQLVSDVHDMLRPLIGSSTKLEVCLDPNVAPIEANRNQVEQIVMNLVVNAADAMEGPGEITIGTADVDLCAGDARCHGDVSAGRYAVLAVRDTGPGIDPAIEGKIFEPFFTTKAPDEGTGLGLSTVYGIVRNSGGFVTVDSELGRGSLFQVYLPVAARLSTHRLRESAAV